MSFSLEPHTSLQPTRHCHPVSQSEFRYLIGQSFPWMSIAFNALHYVSHAFERRNVRPHLTNTPLDRGDVPFVRIRPGPDGAQVHAKRGSVDRGLEIAQQNVFVKPSPGLAEFSTQKTTVCLKMGMAQTTSRTQKSVCHFLGSSPGRQRLERDVSKDLPGKTADRVNQWGFHKRKCQPELLDGPLDLVDASLDAGDPVELAHPMDLHDYHLVFALA